jgi:hypothetical protein
VAAGQLGLRLPNPRKTSLKLLLEAQQHKKYAPPLDDGVSSLFLMKSSNYEFMIGLQGLGFLLTPFRSTRISSK